MVIRNEAGRRHRSIFGSRSNLRTLLLCAFAVLAAQAVVAVPPDLTFHSADPFDGSALLVARTAADDPRNPATFQLKADLRFDNGGSFNETVTQVRFQYPSSGIAARTYTPVFFDGDGNQQLWVMPAGDRGRVAVHDGLDRDLPLLPQSVVIEVWFGLDPDPVQLTFDLALHDNDVPLGGYFFPGRTRDLDSGEYWHFATRHTVDAGGGGSTLNPSTRSQRYALDMDVVAWNGGAWTNLESGKDGSENDHHRVWGKSLYAMHDGTIVSCYRGEQDHDPGGFDDISFDNTFGNSLSIRHGDEIISIAHLQFGWPSQSHCPNLGQNDGLSIPVQAGEFLGLVGNTGRSSAPHIHFQAQRVNGVGSGRVSGVPMQFVNVRALGNATSIQNLGGTPALQPLHGRTFHKHSLVLPNPCGFNLPAPGLTEVARHGIPEPCYQDVFNAIVSRGYRPVWVDGYEVEGDTLFNAVFRPSGPAWVARHNLTGAAYDDLFDELTEAGYRLHQVDSYLLGGSIRYAALFEKRPGNQWAALHGFTEPEYAAELATLADAGFLPVNLSLVEWNNVLYYTALFEKVAVSGWGSTSVAVGDYQAAFNDNVAAGRDPIVVQAFNTSAGPYLSAVFVDPLHNDWSASHGLTGSGYQSEWTLQTGAGRWTRAVTGYDTGGSDTFAGLWRGRADTRLDAAPPRSTDLRSATFEFSSDDPLATFECRLDAGPWTTCSSPRTFDFLALGSHVFRVRARDRHSLRDLSPATWSWTIEDTIDPHIFSDGFESGDTSQWP